MNKFTYDYDSIHINFQEVQENLLSIYICSFVLFFPLFSFYALSITNEKFNLTLLSTFVDFDKVLDKGRKIRRFVRNKNTNLAFCFHYLFVRLSRRKVFYLVV